MALLILVLTAPKNQPNKKKEKEEALRPKGSLHQIEQNWGPYHLFLSQSSVSPTLKLNPHLPCTPQRQDSSLHQDRVEVNSKRNKDWNQLEAR